MKRGVRKIAVVLAALCICLGVGTRTHAAAPNPLLVVEVSAADHEAAERLLELTEQPAQLVRMPEARDPLQALSLARAAGAERVVIFDQAARAVAVLRTSDGELLARATESAGEAPYLPAFVAMELLALSASLPSASQPTKPPGAPVVPAPFRFAELGLRGGVELLPLAPYQAALRPALGLFATARREGTALGLRIELFTAPAARAERVRAGQQIELSRHELALRTGLVWQRNRLGLSAFGQLGLALVVAEYRGLGSARERRNVFVAGVGVEPSVRLWRWLSLYGSCVLTAGAPRGDYRAAGTSLVREQRAVLAVGTGVWLTLPFR